MVDVLQRKEGQRKVTKEWKLAYMAGLMDGEGTVTIRSEGPRPYNTRATQMHWEVVTISNTSHEMLQWIKDNFGGSLIVKKVCAPRQKCWCWSMMGPSASNLLRQLLPFLIIKKQQAEIVLQLRDRIEANKTPGYRQRRLHQDEINQRQNLFKAIRILNLRGEAKRVQSLFW